MEFVVIDFEKLSDSQLSVCEVGIVVFKDGKEVGTPFHSYINPVCGLERNGWAKKHLCHITEEMLLNAPTYVELFPKLQQIILDKILVVHSKGADLNYIYNLEEEYNLPKLYTKWIDTKEVACNLGKAENLADLFFELFDTQFVDHHKALEDARACGLILEHISSIYDISKFVHDEEYLPSDKRRNYDGSSIKHTQFGTANIDVDGIVFNQNEITSSSYFKGKTIVLSGMKPSEKHKIKEALNCLGGECRSSLSRKTDVFITSKVVGPRKKTQAIELQRETGLLIISEDYFWTLVKGMQY